MSIHFSTSKLQRQERQQIIQEVQRQMKAAALKAVKPVLTAFLAAEVTAKLGREKGAMRQGSSHPRLIAWQWAQCGCSDAHQFIRDGHSRRHLETGWGHLEALHETDLFDALYYGKVLPAHPMMLTFDEGYEDMYTDALPVLLQHQDRGIFYIITGMIGGDYMTWGQIQTLAHDGMQIASHTVHHVNIGQPPAGTSTQAELLVSKQTLEAQLDQRVGFSRHSLPHARQR